MMGKTPIDDHQVAVQGGLYHMKCSRASEDDNSHGKGT